MAGRPQVFSRRCATCIFWPGNRMRLGPGRLAEVVAENQATGSLLTCHKTTYGQHPELGETLCRGYWDAYSEGSRVRTVMERMFGPDWWEEVDPPPE